MKSSTAADDLKQLHLGTDQPQKRLYGKPRGGDRMLGQEDARMRVKGFTKALRNCEKMHRMILEMH